MPKGDGKDGEGWPCKTCGGRGYTLTRVNVTEIWKRCCPICKGTGKEKSCQQELSHDLSEPERLF